MGALALIQQSLWTQQAPGCVAETDTASRLVEDGIQKRGPSIPDPCLYLLHRPW